MTTTLSPTELGELKTKQQATWASGNYAVIGTTLQIMGESLCEAVDIVAGSKVLDVAAGNGNASLAAARRGADVTCTDYVDTLLGRAQHRAEADGLHITTEVADAENLPYDDSSFDAVLSTVGVMFAPNPERSAAELIRVCRSGGRIGLANWTPEGFVGQMFKVIGGLVPSPAGVPSPLLWGTDARLDELFGEPEGRSIGVGDAVVEVLIAFFTAHGCIGADALALPGNRATKNFFEQHGFVARSLVMHRNLDS